VIDFSTVYNTPSLPLYHNAQLLASFHSGLGYWLLHDFQDANWWWNQIGGEAEISQIKVIDSMKISELKNVLDTWHKKNNPQTSDSR